MRILKRYETFFKLLKESQISNNEDEELSLTEAQEIRETMMAISIWLSRPARHFYYTIFSQMNIYGSRKLKYKTMATNGVDLIFDPDFVRNQTERQDGNLRSVRFVIMHELLHAIFDHSGSRGMKDPNLWNQATDYAINAILVDDYDFGPGKGIYWPTDESGKTFGLYDPYFHGMSPESIYKILEGDKKGEPRPDLNNEDKRKPNPGDIPENKEQTDDVLDSDELPEPDPDLLITPEKMGIDEEDEDGADTPGGESKESEDGEEGEDGTGTPGGEDGEEGEDGTGTPGGKDGEEGEDGTGTPGGKAGKEGEDGTGQQPGKPGQQPGKPDDKSVTIDMPQPQYKDRHDQPIGKGQSSLGINKVDLKKDKEFTGKAETIESKIEKYANKRKEGLGKIDWDMLNRKTGGVKASKISEQSKVLIDSLSKKSDTDWADILREYFTGAGSYDLKAGSKRYLGKKEWRHGITAGEPSGLDHVVIAVDISGSIDPAQVKTFLNEIEHIRQEIRIEKITIIYCETYIKYVDVLEEDEPFHNFPRWGGGNDEGFYPPFEYIYDPKYAAKVGYPTYEQIDPDVFIYFTDLGGETPTINDFNISEFNDKLIWFCVSYVRPVSKTEHKSSSYAPVIPECGRLLYLKPTDISKSKL